MLVGRERPFHICSSCLRQLSAYNAVARQRKRSFTQSRNLPQQATQAQAAATEETRKYKDEDGESRLEEQRGRMSEQLAQMTEEAIEQGGRGARKAVEEAGFSEELKKQLEARIKDSTFKSDNAAALAYATLPSGAGKGTQMNANAQPWTGQETLSDSALRMLNDAHKPLRGSAPKIPRPSNTVDMRMKKAVKKSQGQHLANARDRTSVYALSQDPNLSEKEREQLRKQLKERFTAAARPMPASVQGLAALANERIEDAIARGQFKDISRGRGKHVEKDYNANSPFLDTTEYFMNKIIQKQEIVPPWIEKQQELVKTANVFRSRLRSDWRRHAARVIASHGGSLEEQVQRAEAYAEAEVANNPKRPKMEAFSEIDAEGRLSQVTMTETSSPEKDQGLSIAVREDLAAEAPDMTSEPTPDRQVAEADATTVVEATAKAGRKMGVFRDPAWEGVERSYHALSISNLNSLTRTYNLQAPDLAKKPYFSLERELRSCFADVAPQLPEEIRERARRPEKIRVEVIGHRPSGVLERFSNKKVAVYDEKKPQYGLKQFWKDLWHGEGSQVKA